MSQSQHRCRIWILCAAFVGLLPGCIGSSDSASEIVVYTALDREFSEPILAEFTAQTGIKVRPKYDTEANKTVGLTQLILGQKNRPQCDLFWNNEVLNTLRLFEAGRLAPTPSVNAKAYPSQYRSPTGHWFGFAARARVLLVNRKRFAELREAGESSDRPASIVDLLNPSWRGQVGVAKPLFGTTATHAACLFAMWGEDRAQQFFTQLLDNAKILPGNRQVAQAVGTGQLAFGLTDTDDAQLEIRQGRDVELIFPDQRPLPADNPFQIDGQPIGTLFIPNSLAIIQGGPNPQAAQQLLEFLLSPAIERRLAEGESAQIPLQPGLRNLNSIPTPDDVIAMEPRFESAAATWQKTAQVLRDLVGQRSP